MKGLIFNSSYSVNAHLIDHGFLLLQWPQIIDDRINNEVLSVAKSIHHFENLIDIVPAYSSLGVFYDRNKTDHKKILDLIKATPVQMLSHESSNVISVPVCYDPIFAPDMQLLSTLHDLPISEIIEIHTFPTYRVCMIGFLPGFMYLSGMDHRLRTSRREEPRTKVPEGAVAIGGNQTGIYPISSPGGWHIIGRSPLNLFDINSNQPSRFQAGDLIKMEAISKKEFDKIYQKEHIHD